VLACNAVLGIDDLGLRPGVLVVDGAGDGGPLVFSASCGRSPDTRTLELRNTGASRVAWSAELGLGARSPFSLDVARGDLEASSSTTLRVVAMPIARDASPEPSGKADGADESDTLTIHRAPEPDLTLLLRRVAQGAALVVSPSPFDVGPQPWGETSPRFPLTITNRGTAPATFSLGAAAPWSVLSSGDHTLAPGESLDAELTVRPTKPGGAPGTLDIRVSDGTVLCGGGSGVALASEGVTGVVEIAAGTQHLCARRSDGTVACWGDDSHAQLGQGAAGPKQALPRDVPGVAGASRLGLGSLHSCAAVPQDAVGSVVCWGDNRWLQAGMPGPGGNAEPFLQPSARRVPTQVSIASVAVELVASRAASCFRDVQGIVYCWGATSVPDGVQAVFGVDAGTPLVESPNTSHVATARLLTDRGGGAPVYATPGTMTVDDLVGGVGPAPNALDLAFGAMIKDVPNPVQLCAQAPARVRCWPKIQAPEGIVDYDSFDVVKPDGGAIVGKSLVGSRTAFYSLQEDGTVLAWGVNAAGQLGDGTTNSPPSTPQATTTVAGLTDAVALGTGSQHACAVRKNGQVVCWGKNDRGQLGDGTTKDARAPVAVQGLPRARALTSCAYGDCDVTCALVTGGAVYCWGANDFGQLGQGGAGRAQSSVPVRIVGL
jgi:hypothetical protein